MNCFIVAAAGTNPVTERAIQSNFKDRYFKIEAGSVWVVASESAACNDICQKLGMHPKSNRTGVVVKMDEYNGFFVRSLWEKITQWQAG